MKHYFLSLSKLIAIVAICSFASTSCKKTNDVKPEKDKVIIEDLTIGSSHDTSKDKILFQGSSSGMVEATKIDVPGKIKEVTAYLQKQDNPELKLDLAPFAKKMIGEIAFNAPKHFHPNIPEDQGIGMYDFYFKIKDEAGEESEMMIIKNVEIKPAPISIDKSSVKMSSEKEGVYEISPTITIGKSAFLAFSDAKTTTPGAKFELMKVSLYNRTDRISIRAAVEEGIKGFEVIESISGIEIKIPEKILDKEGNEINIVPGKYRLYLNFSTDKKETFSFDFFDVNFVK